MEFSLIMKRNDSLFYRVPSIKQNSTIQIRSKTVMIRRTSFNPFKYRGFLSSANTRPSMNLVLKSYTSYQCFPVLNIKVSQIPKWENRSLRVYSSHVPNDKPQKFINHGKEQNRIWTIPNLLCCARISASPILCYYILNSDYNLAVGILFVAGISDLADGLIARKFPTQASKIGTFLDPLADKVLVISLFSTLTYTELIPGALTFVIVLRDVILLGAGSYIRYMSLVPPKTWKKFFDGSQSSAELKPSNLSKINTAIQLMTAAISLYAPNIPFLPTYALEYLWYSAGLSTILSGLSYAIFRKKSFSISRKSE